MSEFVEELPEFEAKKTIEVAPSTGNPTKEWVFIRDECVSGGNLSDNCNLVAAAKGLAQVEVVAKRLSCGCILVPSDLEEIILGGE